MNEKQQLNTSNYVDFKRQQDQQSNFQPDEEIDQKSNKKNWKKRPLTILILGWVWAWIRRIFSQNWNEISIKNLFTKTWEISTWNSNSGNITNSWQNIPSWNNNTNKPEKETEISENWYFIDTKNQKIYYDKKEILWIDFSTFKDLWNNYSKDKNKVYYKWTSLKNIETDKFQVISQNWDYKLSWIISTSKNLINHLQNKENRVFLMTTIASVSNKNQNVKEELLKSSVFAINNFKSEYENLNNLQRWDEMTDLERAKFWVIFLYIKLMKQRESDEIRMSKAKEELKYFIQNSDKILQNYWTEQEKWNTIKWDIWYDEYCIYNNWELYWCFLNKIFITKSQ